MKKIPTKMSAHLLKRPKSVPGLSGTLLGRCLVLMNAVSKGIPFGTIGKSKAKCSGSVPKMLANTSQVFALKLGNRRPV